MVDEDDLDDLGVHKMLIDSAKQAEFCFGYNPRSAVTDSCNSIPRGKE